MNLFQNTSLKNLSHSTKLTTDLLDHGHVKEHMLLDKVKHYQHTQVGLIKEL